MTKQPAPRIMTITASDETVIPVTEVVIASEIALPSSGAPEWIELMRVGDNVLGDGRGTFTLKTAEAVARRSLELASGNVLQIDRDHGVDLDGDKAAYGWMDKLEVRNGALWGHVDWTEDGAKLVTSRAYRFISPTFHATDDHEIVLLLRAAITNTPAIKTMKLIASLDTTTETPMDKALLAALAKALGLKEDADVNAVMKAATSAVGKAKTTMASLEPVLAAAKADELDDTVATAIIAKITASAPVTAADPDPAAFVTMAAFTDVTAQLASLQAQVGGDAVETVIAAAKREGKLSPAMEDWGRKYAASDMDGFKSWVSTMPVLASGQMNPPSKDATGTAAVSAAERKVIASMNVSEEAFLATKKAQQENAP